MVDLLPDLTVTSTEAILLVAQRRQEYEDRQAELAQIAAATPGQEPHVNVPWIDEHALIAFRQLKQTDDNNREWHFPWVTTC